jgi:glycogen debranching enzyme
VFQIDKSETQDSQLNWTTIARDFPELRLETRDAALHGLQIKIRAFAPIGVGADKSMLGFLPVISIRLDIWNPTKRTNTLTTKLQFTPDPTSAVASLQLIKMTRRDASLAKIGRAFVAASSEGEISQSDKTTQIKLVTALSAGAHKQITFYIGSFDANGAYAKDWPNEAALVQHIIASQAAFQNEHAAFVNALPRLGDTELDRAVRWYVSAAILLTRGTRKEVLTMGYAEFNQRDSFWTTWIHLFFWPDLERRMIRESISAQELSGRIPTTILPLIENDAIDITEYFILRVLRFHHWYRDDAFLAECWPSLEKAIAYIQSLDIEHIGLPRQVTYWADWKDVPSMKGRTYAPHFAFLWLAVLEQAAKAARQLGKIAESDSLRAAHEKAFIAIHRDLWNGHYYTDRWVGGKTSGVVLLDQTVGIFFNSIPERNVSLVLNSLKSSETPWGVRETYPYIKPTFAQSLDAGGSYHNGGIWPWLSFVDVTGRYMYGYTSDAERIIKEVARADLLQDWTPSEYLNGNDGSNHGSPIQGWNGAIFAAVYLGAFGLDRISANELRIQSRISYRDFDTELVLPYGTARIRSIAGRMRIVETSKGLPYRLSLESPKVASALPE